MVKSWMFDIFNDPYDKRAENFSPELCSELYDLHFDTWVGAEDQGFDGIFFSEHHFTAYTVSPSPNLLVAAVAAR
ncbi:MAG: luciferase, partial [Modestobacter sp.]|nr:luciferase [Modestobacter sp.]